MRNRSDFMQHRHLVNTPTDSPTTTQPLKPLGYSEFDSTSNSGVANEWELDLLKETSKDGNESRATVASLQASPSRHENKPNEQKETDTSTQLVTERSRKESGDITKPSAGPDERQDPQRVSQPPTLPVRVQEAMVDMKVVNSRHNLLSQVSLKQRDSPRAHDKQATHDNVGMNLHIEGLAMRLSPENSGQRQNKFITSHKEHVSSSPARAHTTRQEGKSKTGSLTIRPVSLQQHSPRISTSASLVKREPDNDISTETITNRDHGTENVEDIAHAHETHQGTEVSSTPSNASHSIEGQENEYGEDSTTNSQKNDSLPSSTVDQSSKEEIEEGSGSQNEENSSPSTVETAAKNDPSNISSSVSQVTQSGSVSDMPKSPIVLVKESSPSPTRLRSSRPVSYHQKSLSFR